MSRPRWSDYKSVKVEVRSSARFKPDSVIAPEGFTHR